MSCLAYLHLVSALIYVGGMVFTGGLLISSARRLRDVESTLQAISQVIKIVHPVLLGALGLLIMTGAAMLTNLKATLGSRYFSQLFGTLGPKLLVVFILALLNTYQFFRLGLPLTRSLTEAAEGPVAISQERMAAMLTLVGRLQACAWTAAVLGGAAGALGLALRYQW